MSCGSDSAKQCSVLPLNMPGMRDCRICLCHVSCVCWLGVTMRVRNSPMDQLSQPPVQYEFQKTFISVPHLSQSAPYLVMSRSRMRVDLAMWGDSKTTARFLLMDGDDIHHARVALLDRGDGGKWYVQEGIPKADVMAAELAASLEEEEAPKGKGKGKAAPAAKKRAKGAPAASSSAPAEPTRVSKRPRVPKA